MAGMPEHGLGDRPQLDRGVEQADAGRRGHLRAEPFLDHGDEPGAAQQERGDDEALGGHLDLAGDPQGVELDVHERGQRAGAVGQVGQRGQLRDRDRGPDGRVVSPHRADEPVAEQGPARQAAGLVGDLPGHDQQVHLVAAEALLEVRIQRRHGDAHPGRVLGQVLEQRAQQHHRGVVTGDHRERARVRSRVEVQTLGQYLLDAGQDLPDRLGERLGERRGFQLAAAAHKQLVIEQPSQPSQGRAHRRLAQRQPAPGLGDVALGQQRVERHQEIQINPVQGGRRGLPVVVHGTHLHS
jgi:hypothetical protein